MVMNRPRYKRLLLSFGVMVGAFVAGIGGYLLWPSYDNGMPVVTRDVVVTPVPAPEVEAPPATSVCDSLDLYADEAPRWPRNGPKKMVDFGVLDSRACRIFHDGHGSGLIDVDLSKGNRGKGLVSVKIDENGFVRNATVMARSERFSDDFMIYEALNVRVRPVKLGGNPTVVKGVLTEKYFEAADYVEKSGKSMIRNRNE